MSESQITLHTVSPVTTKSDTIQPEKSLIFHLNDHGYLAAMMSDRRVWVPWHSESLLPYQIVNLETLRDGFKVTQRNKSAPPTTTADCMAALTWLQTNKGAQDTIADLEQRGVQTFFASDAKKLIDLKTGYGDFETNGKTFIEAGGSLTDVVSSLDWLHKLWMAKDGSQA